MKLETNQETIQWLFPDDYQLADTYILNVSES